MERARKGESARGHAIRMKDNFPSSGEETLGVKKTKYFLTWNGSNEKNIGCTEKVPTRKRKHKDQETETSQ